MDKVLIDSDILLDSFSGRLPFAESADMLLSLCNLGRVKGYVTPVIISNIYYILRKVGSHQKVTTKLRELLTIVDVLEMRKETILTALNSKFTDFDDALQHFSAKNSTQVDIIITRNVKDYKYGTLPVVTPKGYIASYTFNDK